MPNSNAWRRTLYREKIARLAPAHDPAHVEAWMRINHPVLDALSDSKFAREVKDAVACIKDDGLAQSDALAKYFGLTPRKRKEHHAG